MTITLSTTDLRVGDIVRSHGMRIELDREPTAHAHPNGGESIVWAFSGRVLNAAALTDPQVANWVRHDGGRWTVQGTSAATWTVETA